MDTSNWTVEDHIEWIKVRGRDARFLNRIWLNVQTTTACVYRYGFSPAVPLEDTCAEFGMQPGGRLTKGII